MTWNISPDTVKYTIHYLYQSGHIKTMEATYTTLEIRIAQLHASGRIVWTVTAERKMTDGD